MLDKEAVAEILTFTVVLLVIVSLLPPVVQTLLNPSSENFGEAIAAAAINWWVPLARIPLLFLGVWALFRWAGVEELFEI